MLKRTGVCLSIVLAAGMLWAGPSQANLKDIKAYKEAYPGSKVKCTDCHMIVRGDDASNPMDLNKYGAAAMEYSHVPTAERYKKIGRLEDFGKVKPEAAPGPGVPAAVPAATESVNAVKVEEKVEPAK